MLVEFLLFGADLVDMTTNDNTIVATIIASIDVIVIVSTVEQHSDSLLFVKFRSSASNVVAHGRLTCKWVLNNYHPFSLLFSNVLH